MNSERSSDVQSPPRVAQFRPRERRNSRRASLTRLGTHCVDGKSRGKFATTVNHCDMRPRDNRAVGRPVIHPIQLGLSRVVIADSDLQLYRISRGRRVEEEAPWPATRLGSERNETALAHIRATRLTYKRERVCPQSGQIRRVSRSGHRRVTTCLGVTSDSARDAEREACHDCESAMVRQVHVHGLHPRVTPETDGPTVALYCWEGPLHSRCVHPGASRWSGPESPTAPNYRLSRRQYTAFRQWSRTVLLQ